MGRNAHRPGLLRHPERRARSARSRRISLVAKACGGGGHVLVGRRAALPKCANPDEMRPRPAETLAVKGRWTNMSIGPAVHGSSYCMFALRNLHKSPRRSGLAARRVRGVHVGGGHRRPAAIGAGFVRLVPGWARLQSAGARGRRARKNTFPVQKTRSGNGREALGAGAARRQGRELGKRPYAPSGGRLWGAEPPPTAPGAPRFRPGLQFLNANGKMGAAPPFPGGGGGVGGAGRDGLRPGAHLRGGCRTQYRRRAEGPPARPLRAGGESGGSGISKTETAPFWSKKLLWRNVVVKKSTLAKMGRGRRAKTVS